nr:hypothetical protein BaRGS_004841 [Batillaria attramentaria]
MHGEDLVHLIGEWGPYQLRLFLLLSLPIVMKGFQNMMTVVIFSAPAHRCKIPGLNNDTYAIQNEAHEVMVSETIPVDKDGAYDDCQMYTDSLRNLLHVFQTYEHCRFGRKPIFFVSLIVSMVVGVVAAYPGMVEVLITLRFLLGATGSGVYLALYVLTMEFVGPSKRTLAGSLMMVIWLVGPYLVGAISFGIRDWRYIQLLSAIPLVFCISFWWSVVAMTYYGLSLNVDNLVGNVRVNFMLSNTVELVGYVIVWILLDRVGRKRLHFGLMLVCGVALLATIFVVMYGSSDIAWLTTALAMVGKLCVSGAFSVIYLFTAELYPTVLRNFGMGCSSTIARVGSALSPYIADLGVYVGGQFSKALPLIIFGAFAVTAGGLSLILPETLNRKLPDTIEDAVNFGRLNIANEYTFYYSKTKV